MTMRVKTMRLGDMQNLVYLLEDIETHCMAVIDPGWDVPEILRASGSATITDILVTHWHEDHTNGIDELVISTRARVHALEAEIEYWGVTRDDLVFHTDFDRIQVGGSNILVLHTPGHSPGSACFYADEMLFTGDTLFVYGCGRCDLPGGDPMAMYKSLQRIADMFSMATVVYPGHDYADKRTTTLDDQTRYNPFLHQESSDDFIAFRAEHNYHRWPPYQPVGRGDPAWKDEEPRYSVNRNT